MFGQRGERDLFDAQLAIVILKCVIGHGYLLEEAACGTAAAPGASVLAAGLDDASGDTRVAPLDAGAVAGASAAGNGGTTGIYKGPFWPQPLRASNTKPATIALPRKTTGITKSVNLIVGV